MYDGKNAAMKIFIGQKRKKPMTRFWRLRLGVTAASPLGIQRAPSCLQCQRRSESQAASGGQQLINGSTASWCTNLKHLLF